MTAKLRRSYITLKREKGAKNKKKGKFTTQPSLAYGGALPVALIANGDNGRERGNSSASRRQVYILEFAEGSQQDREVGAASLLGIALTARHFWGQSHRTNKKKSRM